MNPDGTVGVCGDSRPDRDITATDFSSPLPTRLKRAVLNPALQSDQTAGGPLRGLENDND